ncbi:MAG: flagellar motor protein MotB [Desulfobacterales bacterium]
MEHNTKELRNRLDASERKRIQLQKMLARKTIEEDPPLWSMVDLMTLLLVFFLYLYSMPAKGNLFAVKGPDKDRPALQISTSHPLKPYMKHGAQAKSNTIPATSLPSLNENKMLDTAIDQLRTDVLKVVNKKDKDIFSIRKEQNRIVLVLGERITFREGEATLLEAYRSIFKRIAEFIISKKGYQVVISGHTDNTPIHTEKFPSNLELSAARAINVATSLIDNGVSRKRVSIQGFSEYRPLFDNVSPENRQANRRVEISLINEQNPKN